MHPVFALLCRVWPHAKVRSPNRLSTCHQSYKHHEDHWWTSKRIIRSVACSESILESGNSQPASQKSRAIVRTPKSFRWSWRGPNLRLTSWKRNEVSDLLNKLFPSPASKALLTYHIERVRQRKKLFKSCQSTINSPGYCITGDILNLQRRRRKVLACPTWSSIPLLWVGPDCWCPNTLFWATTLDSGDIRSHCNGR